MSSNVFYADAVLFDMDGTLTDSIAAVEAAWGKVAADIGLDPAYVIAATHGKRAVDNLAQFKPHILSHEVEDEVEAFEQSILFYADAYHRHGLGSQSSTPLSTLSFSPSSTQTNTPGLTPDSSAPSSRRDSATANVIAETRRPSFVTRLSEMLTNLPSSEPIIIIEDIDASIPYWERPISIEKKQHIFEDVLSAWQLEAAQVDRSVRILPGVRRMIDCIPSGRYAVATSGARTYAYGCMTRVGIVPPPVTITADDKRLKAGKPAPDPFLLAAKCLGFNPRNCVVFEDSPSGIRSGVASGATVIAVCTSHERAKIENCGAHYVVETMDSVACEAIGEGKGMKLKFTIAC